MSTPVYKGPGQPVPSAQQGVGGWLGAMLGATPPAYKTATTPSTPTVPPCGACKLPTTATLMPDGTLQSDPCGVGETVIPVGSGPITIVIQPRP